MSPTGPLEMFGTTVTSWSWQRNWSTDEIRHEQSTAGVIAQLYLEHVLWSGIHRFESSSSVTNYPSSSGATLLLLIKPHPWQNRLTKRRMGKRPILISRSGLIDESPMIVTLAKVLDWLLFLRYCIEKTSKWIIFYSDMGRCLANVSNWSIMFIPNKPVLATG